MQIVLNYFFFKVVKLLSDENGELLTANENRFKGGLNALPYLHRYENISKNTTNFVCHRSHPYMLQGYFSTDWFCFKLTAMHTAALLM